MNAEHRITVGKSIPVFAGGHLANPWRARCSCGWVGTFKPTEAAAETEGDDHVVTIVSYE